jgi:hypothetical protein
MGEGVRREVRGVAKERQDSEVPSQMRKAGGGGRRMRREGRNEQI